MKNEGDYERNDFGRSSKSPMDGKSLALSYYAASIARPDSDFEFNPIMMQIAFGAEEIALAETEQEAYRKTTALTDLTMAAIHRNILALKKLGTTATPDEKEIVDDYNKLLTELKTCREGYVKVERIDAGDEYSAYNVSVSIPTNVDGRASSDNKHVQCHVKNFDSSIALVTENLYRRLNCSVRPMWREVLDLAVRCQYLDPDHALSFKGSGINKDHANTYQNKMSSQLRA